ncbi:hypothetical protein HA050_05560 [Iodobacter sp. HSC-16F04]|uniref:Ribosomal protein L7/L12 C-terminal domain-containing protein n=1 Tax=Iodobacter violaceini TaxID=3044271 RepID=A0ABX0KPR4_9NEIS|nr:hypothetical protein [Iodobacter violacea]NHQ85584.1 hypothetical protein [Iodobacter violacea]
MTEDFWMVLMIVGGLSFMLLQPLTDRLSRIEAKLDRLLALQGIDENKWQEPSAEVIKLARAGEKISALRFYRKQQGAGLKEAKEAIEKYISPNT